MFALSACANLPSVTRGGTWKFSDRAPQKVALSGGQIVIAGPPGYCIDPRSTTDTETGAFALLGSCASIANSRHAPAPQIPAVLTASVSPGQSGISTDKPGRLKAFLTSRKGRAALARDGNPASVTVLATNSADGVLYLHLRDTSANNPGDLKSDYWRAVFTENGRMVTVTISGFLGGPLTPKMAFATLRDFTARIRSETRAAAVVGASAQKEA